MTKQQLDDAKFMMKYLDTTDNKAYQQYFCNYNEKMFAQVSITFFKPIPLAYGFSQIAEFE